MKTVLIGKQKGGVGATTTTRELAVAAAAAGLSVALVDLDPQRTLTRWWSRRQQAGAAAASPGANAGGTQPSGADGGAANPALVSVDAAAVPAALKRLAAAGIDLALIDTPPSINPFVIKLAQHSDLVLAPVRPTTDDIDALKAFLDELGPGVPLAFVITQSTVRSSQYDDAVELLARRGRVAPPLRFRAGYSRAPSAGKAACETPGSKEAHEVGDLWTWLTEALGIKCAMTQ